MPPGLLAELRELGDSLLNGYSAVYFSNKRGAGLLFMAVTFVWPVEGLEAMFCALAAVLFARVMGFDRAMIRSGAFTFNPLLVGLALARHFVPGTQLLLTLALAGVMTTLISACLQSVFEATFRLPQLSLAFVLVTVSVFNAAGSPGPIVHPTPAWGNPFSLPGPIDRFLLSVAAVFSRSDWVAGLLAFLGILYTSRISAALAVIGYMSGAYFYRLTPGAGVHFAGFNFIVSSIAVGGIYLVPSFASYSVAALAAALCAPVALWAQAWFRPFGTDILSLPCLLVIYAFIAGLRMRPVNADPELVLSPAASPEDNLAVAQSRRLRQKDVPRAWLRLPFIGSWHVTQGVNGAFTHRDRWRFALDFSLPDEDTSAAGRGPLHAFAAYGLPAVAPQTGFVAKIVDGIADNEPGHMDAERNWGNYVSIQHLDGTYSLLAHLKKGSIRVKPGDRVGVGEVLGLCGNSGRSPTPHIHYHVQRTAEPGGETLPFFFSTYIKCVGPAGERTLAERSLPREGDVVENLVVSPGVRSAFDMLAGNRYQFEVETSSGRRVETITSLMDINGFRYLESDFDHARVYFHLTEDMFFMNYSSARPGSLLFALLLAVSKVPLIDAAGLAWRDELPLSFFVKGAPRLFAEFALPFIPRYGIGAQRRFFAAAAAPQLAGQRGVGGAAVSDLDEARCDVKVVGIGTVIPAFPFSFGEIAAEALLCEGSGPVKLRVKCETPALNLEATRIGA